MTKEQGKAFYGALMDIDAEIRTKRKLRERLLDTLLPSGLRYDLDKVQTSPRDQLAEAYANIEQEVNELDAQIVALYRERARALAVIRKALKKLKNIHERRALTLYYIGHCSINEIADVMDYSPPNIYKLMDKGYQHTEAERL